MLKRPKFANLLLCDMQKLIKKYKNYSLQAYNEDYFKLLELAVDQDYEILEVMRDHPRTYVAKILIHGQILVLKRMFFKNIKKKYQTLFRRGDVEKLYEQFQKFNELGFTELVKMYGVAVWKQGLIQDQFMLMDFVEGRTLKADEGHLTLDFLKKIHKLKISHGDVNQANFLVRSNNEITVLDTRLNKMYFGNYEAHRDLFVLKDHFIDEFVYPYKKNIFYYLCLAQKKYLYKYIRKIRVILGLAKKK